MPPPIASLVTPALLRRLHSIPHLPPSTWYFLSAVTLSALNLPHEIPPLFDYALSNSPSSLSTDSAPSLDDKLSITLRMREALLKSSAITGLPRSINALTALRNATPSEILSELERRANEAPSPRHVDVHATPVSAVLARGTRLWNSVYTKIASRVAHQLSSCTPDLMLLAQLEYAYVLSGGGGLLTRGETSLVVIAGLVPQDVNPQLKGHLKGAVNNGLDVDGVRAATEMCVEICERAGMRVWDDNADDRHKIVGGWRERVARL